MKYYAYKTSTPYQKDMGDEPTGTFGRMLFELKTDAGAVRRCRRLWPNSSWKVYGYTNIYRDNTYFLVAGQGA